MHKLTSCLRDMGHCPHHKTFPRAFLAAYPTSIHNTIVVVIIAVCRRYIQLSVALIISKQQMHVKFWLVPCSSVLPGHTGDLCALAGHMASMEKMHCTTSFFRPAQGVQVHWLFHWKSHPDTWPGTRLVRAELKVNLHHWSVCLH